MKQIDTWNFSMIGLGQEDEIEEIILRPEIWWPDAVYHEADHCMKWPHSSNVLWTSCLECVMKQYDNAYWLIVFWDEELPPRGYMEFTWWRHQMEMVSTLLALCEGNPPVTGGFPSQRASNTVSAATVMTYSRPIGAYGKDSTCNMNKVSTRLQHCWPITAGVHNLTNPFVK